MDDLESRANQALVEIEKAATLEALDALRVSLLGKNGIVTAECSRRNFATDLRWFAAVAAHPWAARGIVP